MKPKIKHPSIFIAGTDTNVGKTLVTGLLARHFIKKGETVITQKWTQTGHQDGLNDIEIHHKLQHNPLQKAPKEIICPYTFNLAASPHLAAKEEKKEIKISEIIDAYQKITTYAERRLIEGAGGLMTPFSDTITCLDLIKKLNLPVILVIANKLGCINHALLSIQSLKNKQIPLLGLIFTHPYPSTTSAEKKIQDDNPKIIQNLSQTSILTSIPYLDLLQKRNFELNI